MVAPTTEQDLIEKIYRENTLNGTIGQSRVISFMRQSLKLYGYP